MDSGLAGAQQAALADGRDSMSAVDPGIVIDDTVDAVSGDKPYMIFIGNVIPGGFMSWGTYTNTVDNDDVIHHLREIANILEKRCE